MTYITETEDVFYTYKGSLSPKTVIPRPQNRSPHESKKLALSFLCLLVGAVEEFAQAPWPFKRRQRLEPAAAAWGALCQAENISPLSLPLRAVCLGSLARPCFCQ